MLYEVITGRNVIFADTKPKNDKLNIYSKKQKWKLLLLIVAVIIGVSTFVITNNLAKKLSVEERKKVELWALGMRQLSTIENEEKDYTFILEVIKNNETVPVILTDSYNFV